MDKQEIVSKLLVNQLLVSPSILEKLDEKNIEDVIASVPKKVIVITDLKEDDVKIRQVKIHEKKKMGVNDFIQYYKNRYEKIKAVLLKKMDAISINKTRGIYNSVSVIGMAKELTPTGFFLEDETGEIEVIYNNSGLKRDDVIGVIGIVKEDRLFGKDIIFPDIPLAKKITTMDLSLLLTTEKAMAEADYIITTHKPLTQRHIQFTTNPAIIKITSGEKEFIILIYRPQNPLGEPEIREALKKRHLGPTLNMIKSDEDHFALEPLPDVIWLIQESKWTANYKGISILSFQGSAKINLNNREINL